MCKVASRRKVGRRPLWRPANKQVTFSICSPSEGRAYKEAAAYGIAMLVSKSLVPLRKTAATCVAIPTNSTNTVEISEEGMVFIAAI